MEVLKEKHKWQQLDEISFLEVYDTETGKRTVLKEFDYLIEAPNWTKDGKSLIYNTGGRLYSFDLASGESKEIDTAFATNCNNDHVLSPDGKSIAISHMTAEDFRSRIYTLPIEGGIPQLITPMAHSFLHGWSPDGKSFAYCAERNGSYNVYTIPVSGGEETRLTFTEGLDDGSEYSPDGKHIWFNSVRTGLMQIWRMNEDGSDQTQITFDEGWNAWFPHVSPDSKKILYLAFKKGDLLPHEHLPNLDVEIRIMNYDGSDSKTLVKLFGGQGTINVNSWSPCSKKFAFVSYKLKD